MDKQTSNVIVSDIWKIKFRAVDNTLIYFFTYFYVQYEKHVLPIKNLTVDCSCQMDESEQLSSYINLTQDLKMRTDGLQKLNESILKPLHRKMR